VSIREILARIPGGQRSPLGWDEVARYLRENVYAPQSEQKRKNAAAMRTALYMDAGDEHLTKWIDEVFQDRSVIDKRQVWVEKSKYNNVTKRIVNELSTVYTEPATRTLANERANERYQEVQRATRQHEVFRRINRWLTLQNNLAIGFRVIEERGKRRPVIDVVTPEHFSAVAYPDDRTRLGALSFDLTNDSLRRNDDDPARLVWTDTEYFYLTARGVLIEESIVEHGFDRMPWILLSLEPPSGALLDATSGADVIAAHLSVWFENVCLLKESKSATKQPALSGDTTTMTRQQAADTEIPIEMPEGVTATVLDFSMDLGMFRDTADHILERTAANYGIPPQVLKHEGATSGYEIELRRIGIRERRRQQETIFREFEREFVEVQAMVLARDMPELAFEPDGFVLNFGETETPLNPKEELEVFEHARRLTLTDTIDELKRRDPDLDTEGAIARLIEHVAVEEFRNRIMRPMEAIAGSPGADAGTEGQRAEGPENEPAAELEPGPENEPEERTETEPESEPAESGAPPSSDAERAPAAEPIVLNGAQVTSMLEVISGVVDGRMPRASAIEILVVAFNIARPDAESILGDIGRGFKPAPEEQPANANANGVAP
jgi:hypothetical protein